ncbi:MAG: hypothetical protein ACI9KS_002426 [Sulfitobacter sp.]|jgi:hypothetical protein
MNNGSPLQLGLSMWSAMTRLLVFWLVCAIPAQAQSVTDAVAAPVVVEAPMVITNTGVLTQARSSVWIDFPQSGGADVQMELSGGCGSAVGLCVSGQGFIDFSMWGEGRIEVRVRPDDRIKINRRRLGLFRYLSDPGADIPEIYYDVRVEIIDADLGPEGFSQPNVVAPGTLSMWEYTQSRHDWRTTTNLRRGAKIGRIYVQPLFETTSNDIFAAPGNYSASIRLSIIER